MGAAGAALRQARLCVACCDAAPARRAASRVGCRTTTTAIGAYNADALNLLQADVLGTLGADPADTQRKVLRPLHFSLALQASC